MTLALLCHSSSVSKLSFETNVINSQCRAQVHCCFRSSLSHQLIIFLLHTGKTLICIALILLTKGTQCTPINDTKIYRNTVSLSRQNHKYVNGTNTGHSVINGSLPLSDMGKAQDDSDTLADDNPVLSLKELAGSFVKCTSGAHLEEMNIPSELRDYLNQLPYPYILYDHEKQRKNEKGSMKWSLRMQPESGIDSNNNHEENVGLKIRRRGSWPPIKVYLSAATLIVVPANLIEQWIQEFHKFVVDSYLKIYVLKNQEIPPPEILSSYDVVLTTHTRISKERLTLSGYAAPSEMCFCDFIGKNAKCKYCKGETHNPWLK